MQIHGVQCFNPTRIEEYIRLSNEDSIKIKSKANGEEKERK